MKPIKKVAIFLMIIGAERAQRIMALMDNREIKSVVSEIKSLTVLTQEMQECVLTEFKGVGYEDSMIPSQVLTIIRFLFNGSKISDKAGR